MSFDAEVTKMNASLVETFGQSVTYTPADALIPPFSVSGIVSRMVIDQEAVREVRDFCEIQIVHADLAAAGVELPVCQMAGQRGDVVSIPDANGDLETWAVTDSVFEYGMWRLTLKRNVRPHA